MIERSSGLIVASTSTTEIVVSPYTVPSTTTELRGPPSRDRFAAIRNAIPVDRSPSTVRSRSPWPFHQTQGKTSASNP